MLIPNPQAGHQRFIPWLVAFDTVGGELPWLLHYSAWGFCVSLSFKVGLHNGYQGGNL
jgi:hypothetical protein